MSVIALNRLCRKGSSSLRQKDIINDGPYPIYGASGIVGYSSDYQIEGRYVAVIKDGAGVGRASLCESKSSVLGTMQALIPVEGVECDYLLHLVRSMQLGAGFTGSTIPHIYFKDYGKRLLIEHNSSEQRQIANSLNAIEAQASVFGGQIEKLDELVKSRFVEMFGDGSLFDQCMIDELLSGIVSGTNVSGNQRPLLDGEFAVLKISAVTKGWFKSDEYKVVDDVSSIRMVHPRKGDLLFSRANTSEMVGATAIVDNDYDQLFLPDKLWRLDPAQGVDTVFLKHLLSSPQLRAEMSKVSTGTSGSMQNISMAKFRRLKAFLPPIALQQEFASFVQQVDKLKFETQQAIDKLQMLYDSLAQEYFAV